MIGTDGLTDKLLLPAHVHVLVCLAVDPIPANDSDESAHRYSFLNTPIMNSHAIPPVT